MMVPKPLINVCVPTYKRPELLHKLLQSLISQETNGEFTYNVIVIDNDAERSAEKILNEFSNEAVEFVYDVEPRQNISLARNKALQHATGAYVASIDDDECADRNWLFQLYTTLVGFHADVVHGPVLRIFLRGTPGHIRRSPVFSAPNLATGSTDQYTFQCSNSIIRRELLTQTRESFDPAFGKTGGEDILFFRALKEQGYKFIWCSHAKVFESVPLHRANLRWILKRFFRNGNLTHRLQEKIEHERIEGPDVFQSLTRLITLSSKAIFLIPASMFTESLAAKVVSILEEVAFHAGFIAHVFHFRYEEYRAR